MKRHKFTHGLSIYQSKKPKLGSIIEANGAKWMATDVSQAKSKLGYRVTLRQWEADV
jgi:hypothetical protein